MTTLEQLAETIDRAAVNAIAIPQLTLQRPFSEQEAYAIQAYSMQRRYQRGEILIGFKMGFTSKAKMQQMGVNDLIWGRLTDAMLLPNHGSLNLSRCIHPRAEPELCFRVARRIDRPISLDECPLYIDAVAPAVEVIDSRYKDFKFSLEDVIADNCSSQAFAVGAWQAIPDRLDHLPIDLIIEGTTVHSGTSAAILGNPWESVVAAARLTHQYGESIEAGSYLMAGAATPAVYLQAGQQVTVRVAGFGAVDFWVA